MGLYSNAGAELSKSGYTFKVTDANKGIQADDAVVEDIKRQEDMRFFQELKEAKLKQKEKKEDMEQWNLKTGKNGESTLEFKPADSSDAPLKKKVNPELDKHDQVNKDHVSAFKDLINSIYGNSYPSDLRQYIAPGAKLLMKPGFFRFMFDFPLANYMVRGKINKIVWIEAQDYKHAISLATDMWANMCDKSKTKRFLADVQVDTLDKAIETDIKVAPNMMRLGLSSFLIYTRGCGDEPMLVNYKTESQH